MVPKAGGVMPHPLIYVPRKSLVIPDRAPRSCGCACAIGFGAPPPWTPAALGSALVALYRADQGVTLVSAPTVTLSNPDFESLTGWSTQFCALSQVTGYGGSGKAVRVTSDGTAGSQACYQIGKLIVGNTYRLRGKARSDGTVIPRAGDFSSYISGFVGTTSTDWQDIDVTWTAGHAYFYVGSYLAPNGGYVEFDNLILERADNGGMIYDGNCEASTTAAWTALRSTLSKENGTRTGGSGSKVLRITNKPEEGGMGFAYQPARFVTGNVYRVQGYARGDGTVGPKIGYYSDNWFGTASTDWQPFDFILTSVGATFGLAIRQAVAGYVEYDDITITPLSVTAWADQSGNAHHLTQGTATAMPWVGALGIMFDGDLLPWTADASLVKCLHAGDGTLALAYRPTTLKAENRIVATAATAVGNVGVCVSCTNANTVRVRIMNGGGAYDYDSGDVACPIAINTTYAMVLRVASGAGGVSLRVNGTEVISGALTAPSAANPTTGLMLGGDAVGAATNITGYLGQALVVQRAITVAECAQYEAYVAKEGL